MNSTRAPLPGLLVVLELVGACMERPTATDMALPELVEAGVFQLPPLRDDFEGPFDVRVPNATDEVWMIARASTSCGCLAARALTPSVAPGESARVELHLAAQRLGSKDFNQTLFLHLEDGRVVRAHVLLALVGRPHFLPPVVKLVPQSDGSLHGSAVFIQPFEHSGLLALNELRNGWLGEVGLISGEPVRDEANRLARLEIELCVPNPPLELGATGPESQQIAFTLGEQEIPLPVHVSTDALTARIEPRVLHLRSSGPNSFVGYGWIANKASGLDELFVKAMLTEAVRFPVDADTGRFEVRFPPGGVPVEGTAIVLFDSPTHNELDRVWITADVR